MPSSSTTFYKLTSLGGLRCLNCFYYCYSVPSSSTAFLRVDKNVSINEKACLVWRCVRHPLLQATAARDRLVLRSRRRLVVEAGRAGNSRGCPSMATPARPGTSPEGDPSHSSLLRRPSLGSGLSGSLGDERCLWRRQMGDTEMRYIIWVTSVTVH